MTEPFAVVVSHHHIEGQCGVAWWYWPGTRTHAVTYGVQVKFFTELGADVAAATEYGLCVRHSAECASVFNTTEEDNDDGNSSSSL